MAGSPPKPPPPTFPVHPSYEQLVDFYLRRRVDSGTQADYIHEADLYSTDPDQLTSNRAAATSSNGERAWYFFTRLFAKGPSRNRMKRNVFIPRGAPGREGGWVSTGGMYNVSSNNGELIGQRRGFEFKEKVGRNFVKSAWRMMELRLNHNPNEGGQEAGSSGPLVLSKVYRLPNATAEDASPMAVAEADAEAPAASALEMPGPKGADEEIGAEMAAGPALKKRKAGDKDSGAETVASSPGRQNKADGEIESADAAKTGQIFPDGKDPLDAAEKAQQEEPRDPREPGPIFDLFSDYSDWW